MGRVVLTRAALAGPAALLALAGCGGTSSAPGRSPTIQTRAVVRSVYAQSLIAAAQSGGQGASAAGPAAPGIGAFMRAAAGGPGSPAGRRAHSRDGSPSFYYEPALALWVELLESPNRASYALYVDEQKSTPAGSIELSWPTGETYPQVCEGAYTLTGGLMAGRHGTYRNVLNRDGSGESTSEDIGGDGSHSAGATTWTPDGAFQWSSDWAASSGLSGRDEGRFAAGGAGTQHTEMSDGHRADYTCNADGSGSGRIEGPEPGLPATITWTPMGDVRIVYADGTVEEYNIRDGRDPNEPLG